MDQELQAREKTVVSTEGEQTRTGPVFVPPVDIFESEEGLTLLADMPGVDKGGLCIDLKENTLSINGSVAPQFDSGVNVVYREYDVGDYHRQFSLSNIIDQEKITASLKDGVLTLWLPKVAKAKPRQIQISTE